MEMGRRRSRDDVREETIMPYGYGSANTGSSSSSSSGGGWSPGVQHSGMPTRRTTTTRGGGNAPHLRRKTTFTPKTKTTGGSNIKTGPYFGSNINYQKTFNPFENWRQHAIFSNMLKKNMIPGDDIPNYHQLAAYDFDKRFGLPNILSKGLATAYQYGSEGFKALKEGTDWDTAMNTAREESRLNRLGIDGLNPSDMANYQKAFDYTNIDTSTLDDMRAWQAKYLAQGGLATMFERR